MSRDPTWCRRNVAAIAGAADPKDCADNAIVG